MKNGVGGLISTVLLLVRLDESQFFGLTQHFFDLPSEKSRGHFNGLACTRFG